MLRLANLITGNNNMPKPNPSVLRKKYCLHLFLHKSFRRQSFSVPTLGSGLDSNCRKASEYHSSVLQQEHIDPLLPGLCGVVFRLVVPSSEPPGPPADVLPPIADESFLSSVRPVIAVSFPGAVVVVAAVAAVAAAAAVVAAAVVVALGDARAGSSMSRNGAWSAGSDGSGRRAGWGGVCAKTGRGHWSAPSPGAPPYPSGPLCSGGVTGNSGEPAACGAPENRAVEEGGGGP